MTKSSAIGAGNTEPLWSQAEKRYEEKRTWRLRGLGRQEVSLGWEDGPLFPRAGYDKWGVVLIHSEVEAGSRGNSGLMASGF